MMKSAVLEQQPRALTAERLSNASFALESSRQGDCIVEHINFRASDGARVKLTRIVHPDGSETLTSKRIGLLAGISRQ